jgi:hypothetical protein
MPIVAVLLVLLAGVAGAFALGAGGEDAAPAATRVVRVVEKPDELPPLPELRPKVVEPVAGETAAATPEPEPESERTPPVRVRPPRPGRVDVSTATALRNGVALPPLEAPEAVRQIIEAGNMIARTPYKWGGGHGRWLDTGYDCSGSVSFALAAAGLLDRPLASGPLMSWGEPGPGRWVTVWSNPGHVFLEVAGIRFDTSGQRVTGSRWQNSMRSTAGFVARHPAGL